MKLRRSEEVDIEGKLIMIKASSKILVGNCGAVNTKAARIKCNLYGIPSRSYQCAGHSSDESLKRMAGSETICTAVVLEFM